MNNLNLPQVASNQNQKEVTINDQAMALDAALTEAAIVDVSAGSATVSAEVFTRAMLLSVEGASVARNVTLPAIKRLFAARNTGSADVTLTRGSAVTLGPGASGMFYCDGASLMKIG